MKKFSKKNKFIRRTGRVSKKRNFVRKKRIIKKAKTFARKVKRVVLNEAETKMVANSLDATNYAYPV